MYMASYGTNHKIMFTESLSCLYQNYLKWNVKLDGCGQQVRFFQCKLSWVEIQPPRDETLFFSRKKVLLLVEMDGKQTQTRPLCRNLSFLLGWKKTRRNLVTNHCEAPINFGSKTSSMTWPIQEMTYSCTLGCSLYQFGKFHGIFQAQHESPS